MTKRANGTSEYSFDGSVMTWRFDDSCVLGFSPVHVFPDFDTMNEVQRGAIVQGFKKRISDSWVNDNTAADRQQSGYTVISALLDGKWSARGDGLEAERTIVADGIVRVTGKSVARIKEFLADKSKADLAKLAADTRFAVAIAECRAARRGPPADASDLIAGIDAL